MRDSNSSRQGRPLLTRLRVSWLGKEQEVKKRWDLKCLCRKVFLFFHEIRILSIIKDLVQTLDWPGH